MSLMVYRVALRLLGLRVPRARRAEWVAEWIGELWYVEEAARACPGLLRRHARIVAFCRGAVVDGGLLGDGVKASGSAMATCGWLCVLAMVCGGMAFLLPGARRAMRPMDPSAADTFTITPSVRAGQAGMVPLGAVRALQHRHQRLFSELAFYEPISRALHLGPDRGPMLRVGRGSANLLDLLGVRATTDDATPLLVLSEATWRTQFKGSPAVFGTVVKLGLQRVRVAGVIPAEAAAAAMPIDAWLVMPQAMADTLSDATPVMLLGRLAPGADVPVRHQRWQMSVPGANGATDYDCVALSGDRLVPLPIFVFTLFLALLSLPAITTLSLGDCADRPARSAWDRTALRRWFFLVVKIGFLLPALYFGTVDLAYGMGWRSSTTPEYLQLVLSFTGILFGLRWVLRDQRARCPVCLGPLSCPARVGEPTRNFLAWNGTELICVAGHGLLHVPELPTSWCGTQRWLHLDASWSNLFFGPA